MSAFLCSDTHISTVSAALTASAPRLGGAAEREMADMAAEMGYGRLQASAALKLANLLALQACYGDTFDKAALGVKSRPQTVKKTQLIKLISCLVYLCSEFADHDQSPAARFVRLACDHLGRLKELAVSDLCRDDAWAI